MSEQQQKDVRKVVTGKVRLNFPKLFRAVQINGEGEPKFSTQILIPKTDKATIAALRASEKAAVEEGNEGVFKGKGVTAESVIKDADADGTAEDYPHTAGHLYMSVSAREDFRPQVVDAGLNEITDQSQVYSGVYARVSLRSFPYTYGSKKRGVSFGLNNVQIIGGGDRLGGGTTASQDFEPIEEEAGADLL
jgi:hypothetical protein